MIPRVKLPNVMFLNSQSNQFIDQTQSWEMDYDSYSYGQALADLDQDGDLDIVVNNLNDTAFIFENKLSENNYLNIKLEGSKINTQALHAKVKIFYGSEFQTAKVNPYRGYLSSTGTNPSLWVRYTNSNRFPSNFLEQQRIQYDFKSFHQSITYPSL